MTAALTKAQAEALRMASDGYIRWTGAAPQKLRCVTHAGLIDLSHEAKYRTVDALEQKGLLRHGFAADGDVAWAITPSGRAALAAYDEAAK